MALKLEGPEFIDPSQIRFDGDFYCQMNTLLREIRLSREQVQEMKVLYRQLESVLHQEWPGCQVIPFGSIVTGLAIRGSDADCFIDVPPKYRRYNELYVMKARALFLCYPKVFREVICIPRAKVPIVKFYHVPTNTHCDVSFKSSLGTRNSNLIAFLFDMDPRILPLAVLIKYWSKVHNLTGMNLLPNYALIMLIIFYLQQIKMVPSMEWLQSLCEPDIVDYWNTSYMRQKSEIPPSPNTTPVHHLFGGFFKFYNEFDFKQYIVSPFTGYPVLRKDFETLDTVPDNFKLYKRNLMQNKCLPLKLDTEFCIQDVFDLSRNCAVAVHLNVGKQFKEHLQFATNVYENTSLDDCKEFLKGILLDGPRALPVSRSVAKRKVAKRRKVRRELKQTLRNIYMHSRGRFQRS